MFMTGAGEGGTFTDDQQLPNVAFERTDSHPNIPYPILHFKVVEGTWDRTYNYKGTDNGCQGRGEAQTTLTASSPYTFGNDLFILYGAQKGDSLNRYSGSANTDRTVEASFQCPDGSTTSSIQPFPWFYADVLSQILEKKYIVPSGGVLEGSDDLLTEAGNATMLYEWRFEPLFESGSEGSSSNSSGDSGTNAPGGSSGAPGSPGSASIGDVPPYPNVESAQMNGGVLMIITSDSQPKVVQFYVDALTSQGWKLETDPNLSINNITQLAFTKSTKMTSIMISAIDDKTMVVINQASQ